MNSRHEEISRRAFALWQQRGRPENSADTDWLEAERQSYADGVDRGSIGIHHNDAGTQTVIAADGFDSDAGAPSLVAADATHTARAPSVAGNGIDAAGTLSVVTADGIDTVEVGDLSRAK